MVYDVDWDGLVMGTGEVGFVLLERGKNKEVSSNLFVNENVGV